METLNKVLRYYNTCNASDKKALNYMMILTPLAIMGLLHMIHVATWPILIPIFIGWVYIMITT